MKTLTNEVYRIAGDLTLFTEELEDHYGSPELKKKLKCFRDSSMMLR